jgi:hypothetical protein
MTELLSPILRIAGAGLIALALLHAPIARRLRWREEVARMSPVNADIFRVHNFFLCLVLVAMGLPCLFEPSLLVDRSRAGAWAAWMLSAFWAARLYCQWFVYRRELWRGKKFETTIHWIFTFMWLGLTTLFTLCAARQSGWIR